MAVSGLAVWISQPERDGSSGRAWRTACSVITVLGADVPDGRALTSWIAGLARQLLAGQGKWLWLRPGGPDALK